MSSKHKLQFFKHIEDLYDIIGMLGLSLRFGCDFDEFKNLLVDVTERHHINPAFDTEFCKLDASNAFWMIGYNSEGEIVHTQAMKLLDLEGKKLSRHFKKCIADYRSHGLNLDVDKTEVHLSNEAGKIAGDVTYHGEVWVKAGRGGYRGGSLIVLLTRLMLLKALIRWSPDYFIGLQSPLTTCRGLGVREGYMRMEQRTLVWHPKNDDTPIEDWMVWMKNDEAEFNLRLPPSYIYDTFKKTTDPELAIANYG